MGIFSFCHEDNSSSACVLIFNLSSARLLLYISGGTTSRKKEVCFLDLARDLRNSSSEFILFHKVKY